MDYSVLEKSDLFSGISAADLRVVLEEIPHHIQCYDRGETIFHLWEEATRIGIILEGRVEAQKLFPNGSQINVSVRMSGETIGLAAVFSKNRKYPCDMVALVPATVMMVRKEDLIRMMQKNVRILENLITEIAAATYMLQQKLELLSYNGIAQKAAFWLLMQARQTGKDTVKIPDSVSKWSMMMNVSRPSLHRELKKLQSQGILRYDSSGVKILNTQALYDVLGQSREI